MKKINYIPFLKYFVLITIFILCLLNLHKGHNWGGDFSLYIHQAESILEGTSNDLALKNKFTVENSSFKGLSPVLYPWSFPILLTPAYAIFGLNFFVFKLLEVIFLVSALYIIFLIIKANNLLSLKYNLFFITITGFNIEYLKATNNVLSDIPFLLFSFISLYYILKFLKTPNKNAWLQAVFLGFILFFSFSIRTEGIGLFFALLVGQIQYLFFVYKRGDSVLQNKHLPFILPYITATILYFILGLKLPMGFTSHFSYEELISWGTPALNLEIYFNLLKEKMFGNLVIPYIIHFILWIAVVGLISRLKKDIIFVTYLLFLVALFSIWPFTPLRFLYTVYPFILYFLIHGLLFITKCSKQNFFVKYMALFILWICLSTNIIKTFSATYKSQSNSNNVVFGPESIESKEMFAFIKTNTQEQDIIAFFKPRVMHFYTDRVSLALSINRDEIIEKTAYYVETKGMGTYLQVPIENRYVTDNRFKNMFSNSKFNIYKIEDN
ncbi:hypothetical protein Q4Q35_13160 [Flavivirga aquimarina]|uniref:Glycosyltransferase RgtA/B/C/D-like domain-containing protein n=1 Tax=Flavivirga aquimarina TaxID=2027862 RepID=A0ABT8WCB6_9FLAO|nr:hypothetical protein [Flavivirga aquimarina]MDO5970760.1 hypothetical protein [Flavivirga aquimarina]